MADLRETAYPRLKTQYASLELEEIFSPTPDEIAFCDGVLRGERTKTFFLVTLKVFQRLGYFLFIRDTPESIVEHIARQVGADPGPAAVKDYEQSRARRLHLAAIREYCDVSSRPVETRKALARAVVEGARAKEELADIINVAIEELVRQRFELPAFGTLHRAAKSARSTVNRGYHRKITQELSTEQMARIDALFVVDPANSKSAWDGLKHEPGKPSKQHFRELLSHLKSLEGFPFFEPTLDAGVPPAKRKQFTGEAKSLDAARMAALAPQKRYALSAILIRFQRARALDNLGEMFIKRMMKIHHNGQEALNLHYLKHRETTDLLLSRFQDVLHAFHSVGSAEERLSATSKAIGPNVDRLSSDLQAQLALSGNNFYSFLDRYFKPYRSLLFDLVDSVDLVSTSQDGSLIAAIQFIRDHQASRAEKLPVPETLKLAWVSEKWWKLVTGRSKSDAPVKEIFRKWFEICVFSQLFIELKSGDLCIPGSEQFSDYREELLSWEEYHAQVETYGLQAGIEVDPKRFIEKTKAWLATQAQKTNDSFPTNESLKIENGEPILKRGKKKVSPKQLRQVERLVTSRMTPVNILDALVDTENWLSWTQPFGPLSGLDAKVTNPALRYVLTTFCYGSNLGPTQTARSVPGADRRQIAWINQRHVTEEKLDQAIKTVINAYAQCPLPKLWGSGKHASADGTRWNLYEQNLLSEYHVRYGGYGGIGYYHVSDTYIALFSHFIPCGVWEAVYILDGLLKNRSDIQPDTIHGDTQAQSTPVFGLSHLLGFDLMPRIRNWKKLDFYRPDPSSKYPHIDVLFSADVDWGLIETHLPDMLRVALSIRAGKISASAILRRLGTYSRKNRLYLAFRELGNVVRTAFLLRYLSDPAIRSTIQSATNKSEAFNGYAKWVAFGGQGIIAENNRDEQRKIIKYNHLVANLLILHTTYSMGTVLKNLEAENCELDAETLSFMSPYLTEHINRFGDYHLDGDRQMPPPDFGPAWLRGASVSNAAVVTH